MPELLRFLLPGIIFFFPLSLQGQHCTLSAILPESLDTIIEVVMIHSEVVSYEVTPNSWETRRLKVPAGDSVPVLTPADPLWAIESVLLEVYTDPKLKLQDRVPFAIRPSYTAYQCPAAITQLVEKEVQIADPYILIDIRQASVKANPMQVEILPPLPFLVLEDPTGQYMAPGMPSMQYTIPVYEDVMAMVQESCDGSGIPGSGCIEQTFIPAKTRPYEYMQVVAFPSCIEERIPADTVWLSGGNALRPWYGDRSYGGKNIVEATHHIMLQPASLDTSFLPAPILEFSYEHLISPATLTILTRPAEYETIERMLLKDTFQLAWHEVEAICPHWLHSELIVEIQTQLNKMGYACGLADGRLGPKTWQALASFQWENGLPVGAITGDTLQLLGIVHTDIKIDDELIRP